MSAQQNDANIGTPLIEAADSDGWYIRWVLGDDGTARRDYVCTEEELLQSFRHAAYDCNARSIEIACDPKTKGEASK